MAEPVENARPLPRTQTQRMEEIRGAHLDALDEALDDLDDDIRINAQKAIKRIKKSGYKRAVIEREARRLSESYSSDLHKHVAQMVRDAAFYADRAAEVLRAWDLAGRIGELPEGGTVSDSALVRARQYSTKTLVADVEAAYAREKFARLRTHKEQDAALNKYGYKARGKQVSYGKPQTEGVQILFADRKAGLIKEAREIGLSARLHGSVANNTQDMRNGISRIVREGQNMDEAGRTLIREMKKGPHALGAKQRLTKPLERMKRAGERLARLGANSSKTQQAEARREWNKAFEALKRKAAQLADTRGGYAEALQIMEAAQPRGGFATYNRIGAKAYEKAIDQARAKATDRALNRWMDEKQRYNAERIAETESMSAYRAREYQQIRKEGYVTHFIWHLNRGARKKYVRRTKPRPIRRKGKKGGKKSRRCVCETFDGKKFPIQVAKDYPRGGHPFCRCWYEYLYSNGKRMRQPVSEADLEWFDSLPD